MKVVCLLKYKVCDEGPYVRKRKPNYVICLIIIKVNRAFRRNNRNFPQKPFHFYYCLEGHSDIEDWNFVIFDQYKTHA